MAKGIILLAFLTILPTSQAAVCLKEPRCYCNKNNTEIYCKNVSDLTPVENLTSQFSGIYSVRISGFVPTSIPSPIFRGQSMSVLELSGTLMSISDDALSTISGLKIVNFQGTQLRSVPKAFSGQSLTTVQMTHGVLEGIDDTLQNNTRATDFLFDNNRISNVSADAFENVLYLMNLNLSCNQLSFLDPMVFQNIRQLKSLDLSHNKLLTIDGFLTYLNPQEINLYGNNLNSLENAFHPNMENLKWLSIGGNPNLELNSTIFQNMPNLLKLDISDNRYDSLDAGVLKNLNKLNTLLLSGNNFSTVPPGIVQYGFHISTLDLSDNFLSSADDLFPLNKTTFNALKTLKLSGNRLHSMPFGESSKNVQRLDLSRNLIEVIAASDLNNLTSLSFLNFSNNPLNRLDESCFRSHQRSLDSLDLSGTDLVTLNNSIQGLIELDKLVVDSSSLDSLGEAEFGGLISLKSISLRYNNLSSVNGMKDLVNLTTLDVSHNNLTTLTEDTFPVQKKLKKLWMEGNPWTCDCKISWLLDWIKAKGTSLVDNPLCSAPPSLRGTPIRSLNHTILTIVRQDCPEPCNCSCVPNGHDAIVSVDCANKNLDKAPGSYPMNTKELYLNDNNLEEFVLNSTNVNLIRTGLGELLLKSDVGKLNGTSLSKLLLNSTEVNWNKTSIGELQLNTKSNVNYPVEFVSNDQEFHFSNSEALERLNVLDLEENQLKRVELKTVPKVLRLAKNNLSRLEVEGWDLDGVEEMTLGGNPWICDCEAWSFVDWLVANKDRVKDIQSLRCANKGEVSNRVLIELVRSELCKGQLSVEDTILFIAAGVFSLVLCLGVFVFRHTLAAILYSCCGCCSCLKTAEKKSFSFDAFLLFEDADEDFAINTIAEGLENSPQVFKLFVPTRQVFLATESVNVAATVNDCCKIIVILSSSLLENSQCMQLLKSCISGCSGTNLSERFIFITRGGLRPMAVTDPVLCDVMRKSSGLRWGRCLFWQKLRYWMPKKNTRRTRWEELLSNGME